MTRNKKAMFWGAEATKLAFSTHGVHVRDHVRHHVRVRHHDRDRVRHKEANVPIRLAPLPLV